MFNCQNYIKVTEVGGVVLNMLPDDEVHTDAGVATQPQWKWVNHVITLDVMGTDSSYTGLHSPV